jgi:uncharacterized protein (DUF433 family)
MEPPLFCVCGSGVRTGFRLQCRMDYAQYDNHYIVADDDIMGGTPCIRGTRMTVYIIEARVKGGDPVEEILGEYPHLTIEQINAALDYAARIPFVEHPDGRPWRKTARREAAE